MSKPVDRWVKKYLNRARAAVEDYREGVTNPRRDPAEAAISMRPTLEAKMRSQATWDKWEHSLRTRGSRKYKERASTVGADRYPAGIESGKEEYKAFAAEFKTHLDAGLPDIRKMQKTSIEESINKAAAMIRHNAKFKRSG